MGEEVSDYIGRLVPALQTAYGEAWHIEARGESPTIDDRGLAGPGWVLRFPAAAKRCHGSANDHDMRGHD